MSARSVALLNSHADLCHLINTITLRCIVLSGEDQRRMMEVQTSLIAAQKEIEDIYDKKKSRRIKK